MIDFSQTADVVAPQLLGCVITHNGVSVRLTEVEAYLGSNDSAAHTYRGKTERNAAMFGPPGRLYVYFSYGIHHNGNIVCAPEGEGQGCLMRGGEVVGEFATLRIVEARASDGAKILGLEAAFAGNAAPSGVEADPEPEG